MAGSSGAPRTRYASCGEIDIACQVFGDGPIDLLVLPGPLIPIDCVDIEPSMYRFHRRLASFCRVIRLDQRGIGLSSRVPSEDMIGPEYWAQDALAVMDAVGCERATILAPGFTSLTGLVLAADYPERVSSLVIINGAARTIRADDYPMGAEIDTTDPFTTTGIEPDAVDQGFDILSIIAPSVAGDDAFRSWWDMAGNRAASPSMARTFIQEIRKADMRDALQRITVPTLILHRDNPDFSPIGHAHYHAEQVAGSQFVELPGDEALYWVGDTAPMLPEIEEFITGVRSGSATTGGATCWTTTTPSCGTSCSDSADAKSTPPETDSSRHSAAPAPRLRAPTKSSTRSGCSGSRSGWVFTPARSRWAAPISPEWPCTSVHAWQLRQDPAKCWCPRRFATSSPDRGTDSPIAARPHSKVCRAIGACTPWSPSM